MEELSRKILKKEGNIDDWVRFFHKMHKTVNKERPPELLWLEAVDEATKLTEEARKEKPDTLLQAIKLFGWVCGFVGKYTLSPPDEDKDSIGWLLLDKDDHNEMTESWGKWIWKKYPGRCPVCGQEKCICPAYREVAEERHRFDLEEIKRKEEATEGEEKKNWEKREKEIKDYNVVMGRGRNEWQKDRQDTGKLKDFLDKKSLDDQIDMLIDIYGGLHFDLDFLQITAKLLEEVGEVGREILVLRELWDLNKQVGNQKEKVKPELIELLNRNRAKLSNERVEELKGKVNSDLTQAINYFRSQAARSLKWELADVFTWLSAVLHKVGMRWRFYCKEEKWYQLQSFLIEYHPKKYLFSIEAAGLEESLSKKVISGELKKVFETKKFPLSENATVKKKREDEWELTNEEKIYIIKKENKKLNIYNAENLVCPSCGSIECGKSCLWLHACDMALEEIAKEQR